MDRKQLKSFKMKANHARLHLKTIEYPLSRKWKRPWHHDFISISHYQMKGFLTCIQRQMISNRNC